MNELNSDLKANEDDGNWEYLEQLLQNIRDGKTSPTPTLNKMAEIKRNAELKAKLPPNPVKSAEMNYCANEPKGLIQRCAKCFAHNIISRNLKSHREICTFNDCECHQCRRVKTIRNASNRYRNKKRVQE